MFYFVYILFYSTRLRLKLDALGQPSNHSIQKSHFFDITFLGPHNPPEFNLKFLRKLPTNPLKLIIGPEQGEVVPVDNYRDIPFVMTENAWRKQPTDLHQW